MRLEDLQAAARQLPQHQPDEAQKAALRASLVEAARTERPAAPRRRTAAALVAAGAILAAAAAALVWWTSERSDGGSQQATAPVAGVGPRRATIQSSSGANFEHTRVFGPSAGDPIDEVVRLRQGRVAVSVEHLHRGERFRVVTGDAEVEVRGTSFDVVVADDRLALVVVHTGVVDVRPEGREVVALHPGESWRASDHPVRTAALEPAGEASPVVVGVPVAQPPNAPSDPAAAPIESSSGGTSSKPSPPVVEQEVAPHGGVEHHGGLTHRSSPGRVAVPDEQPLPDEPAAPPPGQAPATEEQLAAAQKPAPTTSELAFGRGFRALRRGNYGEASEQFELAISTGPGSRLVDDARYWRAVALARSGQAATAREALGEFLRLHPRSPRAGEASVMLGWMLLESGDRTGAFRRFKAAAADRDPSVRASAAKGLARLKGTR